jgi:hypothetical protein
MAGAGSRTLKLSILADIDNLKKNLTDGSQEVEGFGDKIGDYGKKAGLAFAAAGAAAAIYAGKLLVDGVQSAIADEAAQVKLASALENATGATKAQIAEIEKQITATSLATGVTDDELRPALSRLAMSTNDSTKAQELLNLALDISAQTGKPLEGVANALGKAYDGNSAALGKLGIGMSAAELKAMSFTETQDKLSQLFGGSASKNAETFQGRMDRLKIAFDESLETIGTALLPILEKMVGYFTNFILPIVEKVSDAFSSDKGGLTTRISDFVNIIKTVATPIFNGMKSAFEDISTAIDDNKEKFKSFVDVIRVLAPFLGTVIGGAFKVIGDIAGVVIDVIGTILGALKPMINAAITAINKVIDGINIVKIGKDIEKIPLIGSGSGAATQSKGAYDAAQNAQKDIGDLAGSGGVVIKLPDTGGSGSGSGSGSSSGSTSATVIPIKPIVITAVPMIGDYQGAGLTTGTTGDYTKVQTPTPTPTVVNNITVNGAIDPEGTSRVIVDTLNQSYRSGTGGAINFQNSRSME